MAWLVLSCICSTCLRRGRASWTPDHAGEPAPWLVCAAGKRGVHHLKLVRVPALWRDLRLCRGHSSIADVDRSRASILAQRLDSVGAECRDRRKYLLRGHEYWGGRDLNRLQLDRL